MDCNIVNGSITLIGKLMVVRLKSPLIIFFPICFTTSHPVDRIKLVVSFERRSTPPAFAFALGGLNSPVLFEYLMKL